LQVTLSCFFIFLGVYMLEFHIVKLPVVKKMTTFSAATIYRLISQGKFPKQIKLAERSSGWLLEEINTWLNEKKNARDRGEV
jgi:prophage regulatory protein